MLVWVSYLLAGLCGTHWPDLRSSGAGDLFWDPRGDSDSDSGPGGVIGVGVMVPDVFNIDRHVHPVLALCELILILCR